MSGELPDPGFELACPRLAGRCFTTEPQGKLCQKKKKCWLASKGEDIFGLVINLGKLFPTFQKFVLCMLLLLLSHFSCVRFCVTP